NAMFPRWRIRVLLCPSSISALGRLTFVPDEFLMDRTFDALLFDVALVSGLDAFFHVPALSVEDQGAMFTVHCGPITCPPRPDTVFPGNRANGELVGDRHGIGSFLIIVVKELAAGSNDAGRDVQIEDAAESVEGVNDVVDQFAGAVVPHPVPA